MEVMGKPAECESLNPKRMGRLHGLFSSNLIPAFDYNDLSGRKHP
jgi:hypothetical protein